MSFEINFETEKMIATFTKAVEENKIKHAFL